MKPAVFFQKYEKNRFVAIAKSIYIKLFLRSNKRRVSYLRDAGATIGKNVTIGRVGMLGTEPYLVEIGDTVYFSGTNTQLITHDGGISWTYRMGVAPQKYDCFGRIKIGNCCFIGVNTIILKGVTIGDNCVIGAGSIVTKDIPSGSVACGVPARVIGTVEEYYNRNKDNLEDTIGWTHYDKRMYLENKYKN